jgi:hypothetical protein
VPTPTDGNREPLTVIAFTRAARGKREELKAAPEALIEPTQAGGRARQPRPHQGVEDPTPSPSTRTGARARSSTRTSPLRTSSTSPPRWATSLMTPAKALTGSAASPEICAAARRHANRVPLPCLYFAARKRRSAPMLSLCCADRLVAPVWAVWMPCTGVSCDGVALCPVTAGHSAARVRSHRAGSGDIGGCWLLIWPCF